MKASIVIPAYNEERYIGRTLDSITKQSYDNYEIIVVDCFSEDKTAKIAESYGVKLLQFYKGNIGATRRAGALIARGDVIVSASADIYYPSYWLEKLLEPLKDDFDGSYGSIYLLDAERHEEVSARFINKVVTPTLKKFSIPYGTGDNIALKRDFYNHIGGFKKLETAEDLDLLKRAFENGRMAYVEEARAYSDPRRIREWGSLKYLAFHTHNFLLYNLLGKYKKDYEVVR
ncbi:MAG: glycosyltransferase [Methanobacteriota archaeon]|nr:MAG: glycosyltransferase [Euryarchaeota archaeon]